MTIRNSIIRTFAYSTISLCLSGCWTFREAAHPEIAVPALPSDKDVRVHAVWTDGQRRL